MCNNDTFLKYSKIFDTLMKFFYSLIFLIEFRRIYLCANSVEGKCSANFATLKIFIILMQRKKSTAFLS